MEIRHTLPYVSGLNWVLNDPINETVPIQDQSGQQGTAIIKREPGLTLEITPYLGTIACKPRVYEFKKVDGPSSVDKVLEAAGVDVATIWASSLNSMANTFPVLADPAEGDEKNGPPVYLRLDAWKANLPWVGPKTIIAILGLYETEQYTTPVAYVSLVFADGESIRNREANKKQIEDQLVYLNKVLDGTAPNLENMAEQEKNRLINDAPRSITYLTNQLQQINSQLVAPLSDLLALQPIQESIGALIAGAMTVLKTVDTQWADVDITQIMSKFALPNVE